MELGQVSHDESVAINQHLKYDQELNKLLPEDQIKTEKHMALFGSEFVKQAHKSCLGNEKERIRIE